MKKRTVAILIPAHNEEKVITPTIKSLLKLVSKHDIYVVDDASTDNTAAKSHKLLFKTKVLILKKNKGKAGAMNYAIKHFKLTDKYHYLFPVDADTVIAEDFLKHILPIFEKDKKKKVACVIGKVVGRDIKPITAYRMWEYEISQTVHKKAQSIIGGVVVCPGPSTVFRTSIFKEVQYPLGTLTEDMDLTFTIHRKRLGKIVYQPKSHVITQDPNNLKSLFKQLNRWYTGFWQCVLKHNVPWGGQMLDIEVAIQATEGLINGLLLLTFPFLITLAAASNIRILLFPVILDLLVLMIPTLLYTAIIHKSYKILRALPLIYFFRFFSSFVFLTSFVKTVFYIGIGKHVAWDTERYRLQEVAPQTLVQQP